MTPYNLHNERQLITQCLGNDKRAQKELVDTYGPSIYAYINNYIKDGESAKDILQETFIAVFRALPSFKFNSKLYTWIRTIAQNNCYRYIKSNWVIKVDKLDAIEKNDYMDDYDIVDELCEQDILKAIHTLEESQRIVFLMHVVDGQKHGDIAEILGISEEASRSRLFKAKKRLQQQLLHLKV